MNYDADEQLSLYDDWNQRLDHRGRCEAVLQREIDKEFGAGLFDVNHAGRSIPHESSVTAVSYSFAPSIFDEIQTRQRIAVYSI